MYVLKGQQCLLLRRFTKIWRLRNFNFLTSNNKLVLARLNLYVTVSKQCLNNMYIYRHFFKHINLCNCFLCYIFCKLKQWFYMLTVISTIFEIYKKYYNVLFSNLYPVKLYFTWQLVEVKPCFYNTIYCTFKQQWYNLIRDCTRTWFIYNQRFLTGHFWH